MTSSYANRVHGGSDGFAFAKTRNELGTVMMTEQSSDPITVALLMVDSGTEEQRRLAARDMRRLGYHGRTLEECCDAYIAQQIRQLSPEITQRARWAMSPPVEMPEMAHFVVGVGGFEVKYQTPTQPHSEFDENAESRWQRWRNSRQ